MADEQELQIVDAYHSVGYIVTLAAEVEFLLAQLLIQVGVESKSAYKLNASSLVDKFAAQSGESALATDIATILVGHRAHQLLRHRNNLVHGRILSVDQSDGFAMGRIHTGGTTYTVFWPYDEFAKLAHRFRKLRGALADYLPPLRPTSPPS